MSLIRKPRTWAIVNNNYFEDIDSEQKAYWLGYFAGGSSIRHRTKHSWVIEVRGTQLHLSKLRKEIETNAFIKERTNRSGSNYYSINFSSEEMAFDLQRFHITEQRSKNVQFPYGLDRELLQYYSRGFIDSNSHVYISKNQLMMGISGTANICYGMQSIIEEKCDIKHAPKRVQKCNPHIIREDDRNYRAQFSGNISIPKIINWAYDKSEIHDVSKYAKYKNLIRQVRK